MLNHWLQQHARVHKAHNKRYAFVVRFTIISLTFVMVFTSAFHSLPQPTIDLETGKLSFKPAVQKVFAASTTTVIFITNTASTSWTVPSDWNSASNTIEVLGAGGGGGQGEGSSPYDAAGGGGGGGYSKVSNVTLTADTAVTIAVGAAGAGAASNNTDGGAGGDTYVCNSTSNCASLTGTAVVVGAEGGTGGNGNTNTNGGAGGATTNASGDVTRAGGAGGNGGTAVDGWNSGGGGGGAAGPDGAGGAGGNGYGNTSGDGGGGGGGAANGGGVGSNGTATVGGSGGGTGGGTGGNGNAGSAGSSGGGGGGGDYDFGGGTGGTGAVEWTQTSDSATAGPGGGGGGAGTGSRNGNAGDGGAYGAGGGGTGDTNSVHNGGSGSQGIIIITYTTTDAPPDTVNPTPATMAFSSAPTPASASSISMTSITATDASSSVQYNFRATTSDCASDLGTGDTDSGWQSSASYTDTGLEPNHCYAYTVQARDTSDNRNSTSTASSTYTNANVPGAVTFADVSSTSITISNTENNNPASNPTTNFVIYASSTDARWDKVYVTAAGATTTTRTWLTDAQIDGTVLSNLTEDAIYHFVSVAKNQDNVLTASSTLASVTASDTVGPKNWSSSKWMLYDQVTISASNIDSTLTDFPVYVDLADLSSTFWNTTPSGSTTVGTDIRVTNSSNIELPRELVFASSTAQIGELHFKADSVSSTTNTIFKVWYNGSIDGDYAATSTYGAQNVWSNDYAAVYHLEQGPGGGAGAVLDSTSNARHGTSSGSMTTSNLVTGNLGKAVDFNAASEEYIRIPGSMGKPTDVTLSTWVEVDALDTNSSIFIGIGDGRLELAEYNNANGVGATAYDDSSWNVTPSKTSIVGDPWRYVTYTFDDSADTQNLYIDGTVASTTGYTGSISYDSVGSALGYHGNLGAYYALDGRMDEARIASTSRSAAWISAEYLNQSTTTDFYTIQPPGDSWNVTDWTAYDTITIRHEGVDDVLTDFPVYVDLADLSSNFWSTVSNGGGDIRVTTDEASPTELAREVVSASTTLKTGELHFKASRLSDVVDTSFRVYYNGTDSDYLNSQTYGAENVWIDNYVAVYHDGGETDSSVFNRTATAQGAVTEGNTVGPVGNASDLNGTDQAFISNNATGVNGLKSYTASMWIRYDGGAIADDPIYSIQSGNYDDVGDTNTMIRFDATGSVGGDSSVFKATLNTSGYNPTGETTDGTAVSDTWMLMHQTWDNSTNVVFDMYKDGSIMTWDTGAAPTSAYNTIQSDVVAIGRGNRNGWWTGAIDEFRIASTSLSDAWIAAEYLNQSTTTDFYALTDVSSGVGSSTLANHDTGQVSNAFNFQNKTNEALFAFKLSPESGNATTTRLELEVRGYSPKKLNTTDFTNIRLYRDLDNDAAYDASDKQVGGAGSFSLWSKNNQYGTIVFTDDFLATTSQNYVVIADWSVPAKGSQMTLDLKPEGVDMHDSSGAVEILGSVSHVRHNRNTSRGGGGSVAVGNAAPAGDGDVGGGEAGGGGGGGAIDTNTGGDTIGNSADFYWPTAQSGSWTNAANAIDQTDGTYATAASAVTNEFTDHNDSVPGTDTVEGIEVKMEISGTTAAGDISVELSWDGGISWTSSKTTPTLTTTDAVVSLGGASDTWGHSWSASEFSNVNFSVRVTGNPSSNTVKIDALQVKIYHQASGGGGGGGGAI